MTTAKVATAVIKQLADAELLAIKPLFESVFKVPVDPDLLHWKYAQGRGVSWAAWTGNLLLVHCGVCFRYVHFRGERTQGAQLVDLMASPKNTGLTRGQSPFGLLMQHVLATLPGPLNPSGLAFGFPSARAMQLGERLGVYTPVDDWLELKFQPKAAQAGPQAQQVRTWGESETAMVEKLWANMRRDLEPFAVCSRNFDYVRHRYLAHPTKKYILLKVLSRWRRTSLGLAVLSPEHELLDLIGAVEDLPDVLSAVQRWVGKTDGQPFRLMLTSTFARQFTPIADEVRPTQFRIMANSHMPSDALASLHQQWWLTGGDTDYR